MHRKKYLRMIAAWTMVACMMTVSAGSLTVYAEGAQESERIKIGSDFSKRQTEETETEEQQTESRHLCRIFLL